MLFPPGLQGSDVITLHQGASVAISSGKKLPPLWIARLLFVEGTHSVSILHSSIPATMTGLSLSHCAGHWAGTQILGWLHLATDTPMCLVAGCPFFSDALWRLKQDSRPTGLHLYTQVPPLPPHAHLPAATHSILPLSGTQTRSPAQILSKHLCTKEMTSKTLKASPVRVLLLTLSFSATLESSCSKADIHVWFTPNYQPNPVLNQASSLSAGHSKLSKMSQEKSSQQRQVTWRSGPFVSIAYCTLRT